MQNATSETIDSLTGAGNVILDIWADWCSPCRALTPILEKIEAANENISIIKLDADEEHATASKLGIRSLPTLLFYKDGAMVCKHIGGLTESKFQDKIDEIYS